MDVIDYEIEEINKIAERVICNSKIIACLRSLVMCKLYCIGLNVTKTKEKEKKISTHSITNDIMIQITFKCSNSEIL